MKKYIFNDNTKLIFIKNNCILIENKNSNKTRRLKLNPFFYEKLKKTIQEKMIINDDEITFSKKEITYLIKNLIIKKVSKVLELYLNTRYEKFQIYLENTINDANKIDYISNNNQKNILFIGAGGICTAMIDYLISVGFNNYFIVDFDKIEITNLNRQYKYKMIDIGYLKIEKIKQNLEEQYDDLNIKIYNKKIEKTEDILNIVNNCNPDFIICAADSPIYLINKYIIEVCLIKKIPCIFGGVGQNAGTLGPLLSKKNSFKKYLSKINFILSNVDAIFPCNGSFGITNSLIANYMAKDIIFYLMKKYKNVNSLNKEFIINFDRGDIYEKEKY